MKRPPNELREEIAKLLKLDQENREQIDNVSIATLIESLIEYTKQLEKELGTKKKTRKLA
jgi:hypothetical protein